jgi:hypothetical protein
MLGASTGQPLHLTPVVCDLNGSEATDPSEMTPYRKYTYLGIEIFLKISAEKMTSLCMSCCLVGTRS